VTHGSLKGAATAVDRARVVEDAVVDLPPPPSRKRHRLGRSRRLLVIAAVLLVFFGAVTDRLYVEPRSDKPLNHGLIVVLGSLHRGDRLELAGHLADQQHVLLLSIDRYCPAPVTVAFRPYADAQCFRPDPFTTRGEARYAATYAREHGFNGITVITTADQVSRARLRFKRCWSGALAVVAASASNWTVLTRVPYEIGASIKAETLQRGC
jgi:hypothetical protein